MKKVGLGLKRDDNGNILKHCPTCNEYKSIHDFHNSGTNKDGCHTYCKSCVCKKTVAYRKENPEYKIDNYRERTYGITPEEWDALFEVQGKCCAICKSLTPKSKTHRWATDHDHVTGKVRGILCHGCNHLLGAAEDNQETLTAAIEYLEKNK